MGGGQEICPAVIGGAGIFAVRGVPSVLVLEGGRCAGCIAGDALMDVGVEVIGLRVGETTLAAAVCC